MYVLSIVGDILVDSEVSLVTSSILKICWLNLQILTGVGFIYMRVFIGDESVRVLWAFVLYHLFLKKSPYHFLLHLLFLPLRIVSPSFPT